MMDDIEQGYEELRADVASALEDVTASEPVEPEPDTTPEQAEASAEPEAEPAEDADAEPEDETVAETVERVVKEGDAEKRQAEQEAKAREEWDQKLDELYRGALELHGLDPEQAKAQGLTPQATVERLFQAERLLKENPSGGMAWLARNYAAALPPEDRVQVAQAVLASLGFESTSQLAETERQELQALRQELRHKQVTREQDEQIAVATAAEQVAAFAKTHPHLDAARNTMARIIREARRHGRSIGLEEAYEQAVQRLGLAPDPQKRAEQRRAAVQKAKAAQTPRTPSRPVGEPDLGDLPLRELVERNVHATLRGER